MAKPKLVMIEWWDSCQSAQWTRDAPQTEPTLCMSVGWLVHDGKRAKTIASSVTSDGDHRTGEMTIPTCAVRKVRRLR
jgi:hypothetical protein